MKFFYNAFFLFILLLSQGGRTRAEDEAAEPSRKLNRAERLRPPTTGDSPATRTQCLRRLCQRWPDKLPDEEQRLDGSTKGQEADSTGPDAARGKREVKAPAQFLLRLSEPPSSNRHYSRKSRQARFGRRKRKRSRRQPIEVRISFENRTNAGAPGGPTTSAGGITCTTTDISNTASTTTREVMTYNGEVPAGDNKQKPTDNQQPQVNQQPPDNKNTTGLKGKPQVKKGQSHPDSRPVVFTVVACLLLLLISALLIYYLWRRTKNKPNIFGRFQCPPGMKKSRDSLNECEECTCCSSHATDDHWMQTSDRPSLTRTSISKPPKPPKPKKEKKKEKKEKKSKKQTLPPPPPASVNRVSLRPATAGCRRPSHLSEAELREIQSRIACILRSDYGRCSCCKCCVDQMVEVSGKPKKRRFKLFYKKKKKTDALCEDTRCQENKIRCLSNLCESQHTSRGSQGANRKVGINVKN